MTEKSSEASDIDDLIAKALPENTIVVFQCDHRSVQQVSKSILALKKTFQRYGITAMVCPNTINIMVIPTGTNKEDVVTSSNTSVN